MTAPWKILSAATAMALGLGFATTVWAQSTQNPSDGGQENQCWGQIASQTAKLGGEDEIPGGGMGSHSRSTTAANINGGFADTTDGGGPRFNELNAEGNHGREGVGNVSTQDHDEPGDGGNGLHAVNNGLAAAGFDPVDGQGGLGEPLTCDFP